MRFVIEALGLREGGGKELALNLFSRLHLFPQHEFLLFLPRLPDYTRLFGPNVHCIYYAGPWDLFSRYRALQRTLPRICEEHHVDALLCLGNFAPRHAPCPMAVLIQNAYLVYDEPHATRRMTLREKLICAYGKVNLRRLPGHVHIVVQTPVMQERLLRRRSRNPERIIIISAPADNVTDSYGDLPSPSPGSRPFTFLCLARYYVHKNLEILPEALKKLSARTSRPFRCLITISAGQHPGARKLLDRVQKENLGNMLINLGPVPVDELARVFQSADALILPSLLESYTQIYSEAMRFGVPILTSDRDFARHLCRDAALYFDPLDAESVAGSMARIMADRNLRQRLIGNGRRISSALPRWDEIAAQFIAVLECAAHDMPHESESVHTEHLKFQRAVYRGMIDP